MENTEKKQSVKSLLDKGKASGRLTTHEIDAAIVEMDMDVEELDKLYDTIESQNIEIIDDLGDASLDVITFDTPDMPKAADPDLSIGVDNKNVAMDDPVKVYLKEIGRVPRRAVRKKLTLPSASVKTIRSLSSGWRRQICAWSSALQSAMWGAACSSST